MCGIIGAVAEHNVTTLLLEGLKRLEYRGYDSAGIAVINNQHQLERLRTLGKIARLQRLIKAHPLSGKIGLAHTRWATHGKPSEKNAHPHIAGNQVVLVHNGIIENHQQLRHHLLASKCVLTSETDSELVAHLIHQKIKKGEDFLLAIRHTAKELRGAFAIGLMLRNKPNRLFALRNGSPLVIGLGKQENYLASDTLALSPLTQRFIYLEDGDIAEIKTNEVIIYNVKGKQVKRPIHTLNQQSNLVDKGSYQHFMLKEIFDQPAAVSSTLQDRLDGGHVFVDAFGKNATKIFKRIRRIQIVACGTSYHAGLVGKYWIERLAGIPCQVEIASENRYRHQLIEANTLFITLSQSGETADTLASLRLAKKSSYLATLTICNVPDSSIARQSDFAFITDAGPEIGVASTKAFTTQLVSLFLLAIALGKYHHLPKKTAMILVNHLMNLPIKLQQVLNLHNEIKMLAKLFAKKNNALFIGRGIELPIAMEGALKLKEVSYLHAEAYPAGELKHGPLALIDSSMLVVALAPKNKLLAKMKSNLEEIATRRGKLIIFTNEKSQLINHQDVHIICLPTIHPLFTPILYALPLQLLAYYVALLKKTDVDQPRNLAKSVTVE